MWLVGIEGVYGSPVPMPPVVAWAWKWRRGVVFLLTVKRQLMIPRHDLWPACPGKGKIPGMAWKKKEGVTAARHQPSAGSGGRAVAAQEEGRRAQEW